MGDGYGYASDVEPGRDARFSYGIINKESKVFLNRKERRLDDCRSVDGEKDI